MNENLIGRINQLEQQVQELQTSMEVIKKKLFEKTKIDLKRREEQRKRILEEMDHLPYGNEDEYRYD